MRRLFGVLAALYLAGPSVAVEISVPPVPEAVAPPAVALPSATNVPFAEAQKAAFPEAVQALPALASPIPSLQAVVAVPAGQAAAPAPPSPIQQVQAVAADNTAAPAAFDGAKPPFQPTQLYILPRTIDRTVELGPAARLTHYLVETGWQAIKMGVGYKLGGVGGALGAAVIEVPWAPLSLASRSLVQLGWRSAAQKRRLVRELADAPGVTGVKLLSGGPVEFRRFLARRQTNHVLAMLEAPAGQAAVQTSFGRALPVVDFDKTTFRLTFSVYGKAEPVVWTLTLRELLERRPLPPAVAAAWKEAFSLHKRALGWLRWLFTSRLERETRIDLSLVTEDGARHELGLLAHGKAAYKLALGKKGVPLTEARVVEKPLRRAPLRWLDAFLGREIVRAAGTGTADAPPPGGPSR